MNIKRAKEEIKNAVEAYLWKDEFGNYEIPAVRQRPILLIGPPGVGKTQIMEQVAKECGIGLVAYTITHHTRQSAVGLPVIERRNYAGKEYTVTEYTMSEIVGAVYDKMEATGLNEGILFIDEINCVSETLAPAMLQFLQCKTFGTHRIPEGWLIVAAGNPPEYNKSVREFDIVTLDRIRRIDVEPDVEVWKAYAVQESIHPAVVSYIQIKKQNFCRIETTVDGPMFVTPRSWEDLSRLITVYEKAGKMIDREVVIQYLQYPKIAKDFANYLSLYHKYQKDYQVDEILAGNVREGVYEKIARAPFDERLSIVGLLLSRLSGRFSAVLMQEQVMERAMKILRRFPETEAAKQSANPVERLSVLLRETEEEWEKLKKQELLTRKEDLLYRKVVGKLEKYRMCLYDWAMQPVPYAYDEVPKEQIKVNVQENQKIAGWTAEANSEAEAVTSKQGATDSEAEAAASKRGATDSEAEAAASKRAGTDGEEMAAAWAFLRDQFAVDSDHFEEEMEQTGQMLEYGFDFMEAAFGDSQEMVMFITELNGNASCIGFLQEYDCARYYEYNQRLLFDEREQEILAERKAGK